MVDRVTLVLIQTVQPKARLVGLAMVKITLKRWVSPKVKKNKNVNRVTKGEQSKGGADTSENSLDSAHAF